MTIKGADMLADDRRGLCSLIETYAPNFDPDTGIPVGSEVEQLADIILNMIRTPRSGVIGEEMELVKEACAKVADDAAEWRATQARRKGVTPANLEALDI